MDPNIITLINTFAVENARLKEDVKTAKAELQLWKEGAQEMCDGIRQSWITQETVLQQFCKRVGIEWRDDPKAASLRQRPIVSVDEKHGLADSPQNSISGGNYDLANSSRTSNSFDGNNRVANSPQTSTTFADKLSGYLKDPPRIPSTSSSMKWKPRQDGAIDWMKDGNSGVELVYDSDPIASEEEYPRWEYPRLDEAELDFVEAGGRSKSPKQSDVAESAIESDEDSHDDDFDANVLELPSADGDVEIRENTPNNPESASVSKGTKGSSVGSAVRRKMRDPSPEEGRSDGDLALAPYELEEDDEDEPINHSLPLKDFVNRLPRGRLIVYILHQANAGIKTPLKLQEISAKLKEHLDVDYNAAQVRKAASAYMLKKGEKSPIVRAEKGLYALKSEYLGDQLFARKGFGNLGVLARKQKGVPADRISSSLPASSTPQHQAAPQSTSETSIEVATAPRPASPPGTAAPRGGRSPAPSKVDLVRVSRQAQRCQSANMLAWKCLKCGREFAASPGYMKRGIPCAVCKAKRRMAQKSRLRSSSSMGSPEVSDNVSEGPQNDKTTPPPAPSSIPTLNPEAIALMDSLKLPTLNARVIGRPSESRGSQAVGPTPERSRRVIELDPESINQMLLSHSSKRPRDPANAETDHTPVKRSRTAQQSSTGNKPYVFLYDLHRGERSSLKRPVLSEREFAAEVVYVKKLRGLKIRCDIPGPKSLRILRMNHLAVITALAKMALRGTDAGSLNDWMIAHSTLYDPIVQCWDELDWNELIYVDDLKLYEPEGKPVAVDIENSMQEMVQLGLLEFHERGRTDRGDVYRLPADIQEWAKNNGARFSAHSLKLEGPGRTEDRLDFRDVDEGGRSSSPVL